MAFCPRIVLGDRMKVRFIGSVCEPSQYEALTMKWQHKSLSLGLGVILNLSGCNTLLFKYLKTLRSREKFVVLQNSIAVSSFFHHICIFHYYNDFDIGLYIHVHNYVWWHFLLFFFLFLVLLYPQFVYDILLISTLNCFEDLLILFWFS